MGVYRDCACLGKFKFTSKASAEEAVRHNENRGRRVAYKCKSCKQWHLGNVSSGNFIDKKYKKRKRDLRNEAEL
jgi:hypothetical protein